MGLTQMLKCVVWNKRHSKNIFSNYTLEDVTYHLDLFSGKMKINGTLVTLGPHSQGRHLAQQPLRGAGHEVPLLPAAFVHRLPPLTSPLQAVKTYGQTPALNEC